MTTATDMLAVARRDILPLPQLQLLDPRISKTWAEEAGREAGREGKEARSGDAQLGQ